MISGHTTKNGKRIILLGLTREVVLRGLTTQKNPIWIAAQRGHQVPDDTEIYIFFGESEAEIVNALAASGVVPEIVEEDSPAP